jgi:hypothetical protein
MFDEEDFSTNSGCSGSFYPTTSDQLNRLFGQDDELPLSDEECRFTADTIATTEFEVLRSQINSIPASSEPLQALPKTIPICIILGPNLTDPAEKACGAIRSCLK